MPGGHRDAQSPLPSFFRGYSDPFYNLGIFQFPPIFRTVLGEAVLWAETACCNLLCDFRQFTLEILYLKKLKSERFCWSNDQSLIASKMTLSRANFSREKQTVLHMDVSIFTKFFPFTWNFWTCSSPAPKFPKFSENSSPTRKPFGFPPQKCHQELTLPGKSWQFSPWMSLYAQNLLLHLKLLDLQPSSPQITQIQHGFVRRHCVRSINPGVLLLFIYFCLFFFFLSVGHELPPHPAAAGVAPWAHAVSPPVPPVPVSGRTTR